MKMKPYKSKWSEQVRKRQKKREVRGIEPPEMDSRGIEPRTTPMFLKLMLREYYTTLNGVSNLGAKELDMQK